jgi:hypothetical protein
MNLRQGILAKHWSMIIQVVLSTIFFISSCNSVASDNRVNQITQPSPLITPILETIVSQKVINPIANPSVTVTGSPVTIISSTSSPDTRLTPYYWREWPETPELSQTALKIIEGAVDNLNLDLHAFSKVGDCQMTSSTFLRGFTNGKYKTPDGYIETIDWFSTSMATESITAANGLGINSVLNPMFGLPAGNTQCNKEETPLDCELRTRHPAFVLIAMGTNWKPNGEISFEKYLRVVVERILATGALPILATKADNIEKDWKLNQAIAQIAYEYDLPLVNVWHSVQDLPNHGLVAPKNIYLTGDGWMRRNYAWLEMLEKIRIVVDESK